jgi:hypothetical protein
MKTSHHEISSSHTSIQHLPVYSGSTVICHSCVCAHRVRLAEGIGDRAQRYPRPSVCVMGGNPARFDPTVPHIYG